MQHTPGNFLLNAYNFTTDKSYEREKEELVKKYEEQVQFLRQQLHNLEDKMESEREALTKKFQDDRAGLEEELACAIREELKVRSKDQRSWQKDWSCLPLKFLFWFFTFTIETQRKAEKDGKAGDL